MSENMAAGPLPDLTDNVLVWVNLSCNAIEGALPKDWGASAGSLQVLSMRENRIGGGGWRGPGDWLEAGHSFLRGWARFGSGAGLALPVRSHPGSAGPVGKPNPATQMQQTNPPNLVNTQHKPTQT
jgi:hypothetical protein